MTDRKKAGRGPEITAFSVKDFTTKGGRKESAWKRIGMALQHSDEMGFEVKLKEYPAPDCRLVLRMKGPKSAKPGPASPPPRRDHGMDAVAALSGTSKNDLATAMKAVPLDERYRAWLTLEPVARACPPNLFYRTALRQLLGIYARLPEMPMPMSAEEVEAADRLMTVCELILEELAGDESIEGA